MPSRARSVLTSLLCGAMLAVSLVAFAPPAAAQTSMQDPASPATAQALSQGQSYACNHLSLTGPNFTNAGTAGDSYSGQNLANANFAGTDLRGTQLQNADLTGADFTGAKLGVGTNGLETNFSGANLSNACLHAVTLAAGNAGAPGANFLYANLSCTAITSTDITAASFGPVITAAATGGVCRTSFAATIMTCEFLSQWPVLDLSYANISACTGSLAGMNLTGSVMIGVQMPYVNLRGTNFSAALLDRANLYSTTLVDAVFDGADLRYATLSSVAATYASFQNQARLSGATMSYGTFESAKFNSAVFQEADGVPAATMSFANFHNADFTGAAMLGVNLSGALLYDGAVMKSATIQNANLANATLWNLNLKSAALNGITFDYSNLINAKLSGASLSTDGTYRASSLVKSNLQGADLTGADLSGVNMANAAVALANGVPLFPISNDVSGLQDDLNNGYLTAELNSAFEQHGYALNYCSSPSMTVLKSGQAWDIVLHQLQGVGPKGASYRAFLLAPVTGGGPSLQISGIANGAATPIFTISGDFAAQLNKQLIPRAVFSGFSSNRYKLPACSDPVVTANRVQKTWTISADVTASISPVVGYTGFTILNPTPTTLQVYGSQLTAFYQGDDGRLRYSNFTVTPTTLGQVVWSANTVMPNGNTYSANQSAGLSLDAMLTAPSPPAPPTCAPGSPKC